MIEARGNGTRRRWVIVLMSLAVLLLVAACGPSAAVQPVATPATVSPHYRAAAATTHNRTGCAKGVYRIVQG